MATVTEYISIEQYTDRQGRHLKRLIDSLDKGGKRLETQYGQVRKKQRSSCLKPVQLKIPQSAGEAIGISVYMRDISSRGASFLYPGELGLEELTLGIPIPDRETAWFQCEVKRCKQIMDEDFWEYGVMFTERLI